jgi:hypothetical protein
VDVPVSALRAAGRLQARLCREGGSPTWEAVVTALIDSLDDDGHAASRLLRRDGRPAEGSALYLRLLGAAHRRALSDPSCPLRQFLPTTGGALDPDRAVGAFFAMVEENETVIAEGMAAPVQTNDVGRAAALSAAMQVIGGPLRLLEIGTSAGLNLSMDRYRVVVDENCAWGPPASPVVLTGHFESGRPPVRDWSVTTRSGCDLHPLDPTAPSDRLTLQSFVWPEHVDRMRLLAAAAAMAGPMDIAAQSGGRWLRTQLRALPSGVTTVVFHSIVVPYLGADERQEIVDAVSDAGSRADADHRLAWVTFEPSAGYAGISLSCRRFPGDTWLRLATATPHARRIRWDPVSIPDFDWVAPD